MADDAPPPGDLDPKHSHENVAHEIFNLIDRGGTGALTKKEIGKLMAKMGEKTRRSFFGGNRKLDAAFAEMDPSGDGVVDFVEFFDWFRRKHPESPHDEELAIQFELERLDKDPRSSPRRVRKRVDG